MREDDQGQDQDRVNSSFFHHQTPPPMQIYSSEVDEEEEMLTENCIEIVRAFSQKPQESLSKSANTTNTSRSSKKSSKSMFNYLWSFLIVILAVFLNVQMAFGLAETEGFVTESDLMGPLGEYVTTSPVAPAPAYIQNHQIFAKGSTTPRAHRGANGHSDHSNLKNHGVPYEGKSPGLAHWREKYMLMNESLSHEELKKELQKEKKVPPISAMKPQPRSTTSTTTSTTTKPTTTTQSPPFPGLVNETREALQEGESHHQPIVFVGGAGLQGFIPPSNLRARPLLGADSLDPLWNQNPYGVDARFPAPLQSAWDRNYRNPFNMTRVQHIEAECQDDFMKIRVAFNGSFNGLVYSSGYSYDPDCIYVNGTGGDYYEYLIRLNRCGTLGARNHAEGRKEPSVSKMFNTITIQYNPMIEEEWDEHFKVTCEYGYDFWKTVTFPFLDVEVATGNPVVFTLTPPECHMEIRYGFGATGQRVGGPVRVGDPLTLMINMRSQYDGFDIVVNDCYAHNGATKKIQLIDHYGCPVDSKLMSPFRGTWTHTNVYETQVYAYLKTFRFTGSPALYIECDVRMCHGHCPSQPCYWRNIKHVNKRSIDDNSEKISNSSLSENISLFQALRVLQEDEDVSDSQKSEVSSPESVCIKSGTLSALIGAGTLIFVLLGMILMVMCFRLRRFKNIRETESTSDILRPYSHHASQWSSTSSLAKPQRILP